jgi:hypothetical protein
MLGILKGPAVTRRQMTDISRISSATEHPQARSAHGSGQPPAIITFTFTA